MKSYTPKKICYKAKGVHYDERTKNYQNESRNTITCETIVKCVPSMQSFWIFTRHFLQV